MITIEVHQNHTLVQPWLGILEGTCTARLRRSLQGADLWAWREDPRKYLASQPDGSVVTATGQQIIPLPMYSAQLTSQGTFGIIYTGLLQTVCRKLDKLKQPYTVIDKRDYSFVTEDLSSLQCSFRDNQEEVLRALLKHPNGIIKAPPAFGKSFIIKQYCKLRANKDTVLVVTNRKTVLGELYKNITAELGKHRVGMVCAGKPFNEHSRVIVCSSSSLHNIPEDWPSVILYDECHGAAAENTRASLMRFSSARYYGLSATPSGRGDGIDKVITALFGELIYEITYTEARAAGNVTDMEVRMVPVTGPEPHWHDDISFQRNVYWRNSIRNRKIADAVVKLATDGIDKVLILVKTAEHAYYLRMFLPDFNVLHESLSPEKVAKFKKLGIMQAHETGVVNVEALKEDFKHSRIKKLLGTMSLREGCDFVDLPVVIRADGQTGSIPSIQIGGRSARVFEGKHVALVIDFKDDFGEKAYLRACAREGVYSAEGWRVIDWPV